MRSSKVIFISIATGRSVKYLLDTVLYDYLKNAYFLTVFTPFSRNKDFVRKYGGEYVKFSDHPCITGRGRAKIGKVFDRLRFLWPIFRLQTTPLGVELGYTRKRIYPLGYKLTKIGYSCLKPLGGWRTLRRMADYVYFNDYYYRYFKSENPALVILPSPSKVTGDYCLQSAATAHRVPTLLIPSSWDNFTTGGEFPFQPTRIFSWGPEMSRHAKEFFGFSDSQIFDAGMIRLEPIERPVSPEIFRDKFRIPEGFRSILFPTNQHYIVAPEPRILDELVSDIEAGKLGRAILIVRPNNTWGPMQKEYIRKYADHPLVRINLPEEDAASDFRQPEVRWIDVLQNVDVVMTICSMMVLEAFHFDKPVINLDYDYGMMGDFGFSYRFYYGREVYRKIKEIGATRFVRSREELIEAIRCYLDDPTLEREERRKVMELWDVPPIATDSRSKVAVEQIRRICKWNNSSL